jgi:hypothetical protein
VFTFQADRVLSEGRKVVSGIGRLSFLQRGCPYLLAVVIVFLLPFASVTAVAASPTTGPLVVDENSHVVVMEYEAWFGPNAVTFQGSAAMPLLQSADMKKVGGGYDSADPAIIQQHLAWLEFMGADAATSDLTNNVSCIFNSEWFVKTYVPNCSAAFRLQNQTIRDNTGNIYSAWTKLRTRLGLIPILGGIDENVLFKDQDGKTAFEKEVEYFGALLEKNPDRAVIYKDKPLMVIFLGAAQDPNRSDHPLWFQLRQFLREHPEMTYTFKMMAGYLDSQPGLWATQGKPHGPVKINPAYGFWSWVDRLNPSCTISLCPYYPSYNQVGSRVENFTASIATAGQFGWQCPDGLNAPPYCPDDALRFGANGKYVTFDSFMKYVGKLRPIFLWVHQFNEFTLPDEGFDANTNDDIEPTNLWGSGDLEIVKHQILMYRQQADAKGLEELP